MTDNCSYYSQDFMSNGFYKLYADEPDEDILLWNSTSAISNYPDYSYQCLSDFSEKQNTEVDASYWTAPKGTTNDWDLNIENLLLDDALTDWEMPSILPDKTVLCNDSCNIFLKESSENLLFNLQAHPVHSTVLQVEPSEPVDADKNFICSYSDCKKIYAKAAHLKAHLRRHIGDKPYVCTWPNCTWKFSRSDELSRHRRSHSGVKPYKCVYCPKCFSRSDHLTKHRRVHERKMAAMKIDTTSWIHPVGRPGRKPTKRLI